jgi:hypothetical protein
MEIKTNKLSRLDIPPSKGYSMSLFLKIHNAILKRWMEAQRKQFWKDKNLTSFEETHALISKFIRSGSPRAVGRLGGVEASVAIWAKKMPLFPFHRPIPHIFADTSNGADIAGIRPRNKDSYRAFAELIWNALQNTDFQGVWSAGYEALCLPQLKQRPLYDVEIIAPSASHSAHWMHALRGRRILIVSPFKKTIESQIPKLGGVWPQMPWFSDTHFEIIQFPYLIQPGCPEAWWEVYERIGKILSEANYDIALLGCGGLGLPFASLAKNAGRVAIHLGGHLQLLFGIYGQRHLDQPWHRQNINENWVRPETIEVPECAPRVEGGGYW